ATGRVWEGQEGEAAGLADPFHDPLFEIANHTQWLARIIRNLRSLFQRLDRERDVRAMMELFRLL
ncbi:MAG: hypothetical protein GTO62_19685, partial [Planctomycetales bacterium]|nr:hypothetical protein [Planctomycetales bacterium]NIP71409.1 hypothetical protein [Planctomycetales bacterium]